MTQTTNEDPFKQYDGFYTIGDVQAKLKEVGVNKPIPTIRNWVNDLHHFQVHTLPRNARGERIFRQIDIDIIRFIAEAKSRYGNNLTMNAICDMIRDAALFKDQLNYDPSDGASGGGDEELSPTIPEHRIREFLRSELEEIQRLKEEMIMARNEYESQMKLLPNPEEDKKARSIEMRTMIINSNMLERKVKTKLKAIAEEEWKKNPVTRGIFKKTEDLAAKLLFIDKYVDDNFEDYYKKELDNQTKVEVGE